MTRIKDRLVLVACLLAAGRGLVGVLVPALLSIATLTFVPSRLVVAIVVEFGASRSALKEFLVRNGKLVLYILVSTAFAPSLFMPLWSRLSLSKNFL